MDSTLTPTEHHRVSSSETAFRYRILFSDGSVGTRFYATPLRVGQPLTEGRAMSHVISEITQEPEYGSLGRARAVLAPS